MPQALAKLLDGTRVTVVVQSAKTLRMIYNTCEWIPSDAEAMTGRYGFEPTDQICYSWITNDELAFATYVDQLITEQPLNRPSELEQLHLRKTTLAVLLNNGRMGDAVTNSIWFTKQGDLKMAKRKALKTSLWTRPDNLLANIVQLGGHSVETVPNITHGLFVQFEVGEHSYE